jgi:hypothetical protein
MSNPWLLKGLGIKVNGGIDDMKFKIVRKKKLGLQNIANTKEKSHLEEETLRIKKLIYDALNENTNRAK